MRSITETELKKIIENHLHYLNQDCEGWEELKADLSYTNLCGVNLCGADLRDASFRHTDLSGANLSYVNLCFADLCHASLSLVNLYGAKLQCANLRGADLRGADLRGAANIPYIPLACPSDGSFVGWKKVNDELIKLEIPEDARRVSATTNKCRCDKAKVLGIYELDGITPSSRMEITNTYYIPHITYKVGEMVYPDSFDDNRWNECSNGIHFFIGKQDAMNYY